jgi:hypothetical protein
VFEGCISNHQVLPAVAPAAPGLGAGWLVVRVRVRLTRAHLLPSRRAKEPEFPDTATTEIENDVTISVFVTIDPATKMCLISIS